MSPRTAEHNRKIAASQAARHAALAKLREENAALRLDLAMERRVTAELRAELRAASRGAA